jgi:hypothetical protein
VIYRMFRHIIACYISCCCYPERDIKYSRWKMAIERSLGWVADKENTDIYEEGMNNKH